MKLFRPGEHLLNFVGEVIDRVEYEQRTAAGKGGYMLSTRAGKQFLDCYATAANSSCLASMANSPFGCRNIGENDSKAVANSKLAIAMYPQSVSIWSLKATRRIKEGDEILYPYSRSYVYPAHYGPALL